MGQKSMRTVALEVQVFSLKEADNGHSDMVNYSPVIGNTTKVERCHIRTENWGCWGRSLHCNLHMTGVKREMARNQETVAWGRLWRRKWSSAFNPTTRRKSLESRLLSMRSEACWWWMLAVVSTAISVLKTGMKKRHVTNGVWFFSFPALKQNKGTGF